MFSWNQMSVQQFHPLQTNFFILYNQMEALRTQFDQLQNQNEIIKKNIQQIDQRTAQIQLLATKKLNITQEIHYLSDETRKRKKTFNSQDEAVDILLDQKQYIRPKNRQKPLLKSNKQQKSFCCPYHRCERMYKSSFSLNLHIKIFHNGGSKRQRQKYASIILEAQQNGVKAPEVPITFPEGFLKEFRSSFNYMKKYKM